MSGLEFILADYTRRNEEAGGNFPAVVSISLWFTPSDIMDAALQDLFDAGLLITASAGNRGLVSCSQSPARAPASISVMSSGSDNVLAANSNFGDCADIIAPGVEVRSTYITGDDSHATFSGTSMACPHVAGVLLRYMTQVIAETGKKPTPSEARTWLFDNATKDAINLRGRPDTKNLFVYAPCDLMSL